MDLGGARLVGVRAGRRRATDVAQSVGAVGASLAPATVLARLNFVGQLLNGIEALPSAAEVPHLQLDGVLGKSTQQRLSEAGTDRDRWLALLAGPEFQLK